MPERFSHFDQAERAALFDAVERAASQVGLAVFVVHANATPPVIAYASATLGRLVGRPPSELAGGPPWAMLAPEYRDKVRTIIASRGPGAPPITVEVEVERPDGVRRDVEVGVARVTTPTAELAVCFIRDVTDARAAVNALRQSEARFRSLIEDAPDGVVILTRGRIALANPVAARLLGAADPASLRGRMISEFLPPDDAARAMARIARIAQGETLGASEYHVIGSHEHVIEIHSIPCEWEGGPAILAFARDVTERRKLQQELDRSARLAAVGTMAAAVAHEINNPLTYVQLSLQRMERELAGVEPARAGALREHIRNAMHGTDRVATIVRDLRTFARDDEPPVRPVDVIEVIEGALKMVEHDLRHRARLVRKFVPVPAVEAVASRLEQVVVNLLINAIQALPAADPGTDEVTVEVRAAAGAVAISVRDTGIGIAAEDRERVFEPFFTTKPVGEGTGLGLAVCKRIVEAMGGRIAITSPPGAGTEVTVTLPEVAGAVVPDPVAAAPDAARRLRVLVIDDDPMVRKVLRFAVATAHDVEDVPGGDAAMTILAERTFDVIVCDVMMPGMNGRDVHDRVRERYPGLERRIVLVTGGAFVPRLAEFLQSVDNLKLHKPFTEADVLGAIAAAALR